MIAFSSKQSSLRDKCSSRIYITRSRYFFPDTDKVNDSYIPP